MPGKDIGGREREAVLIWHISEVPKWIKLFLVYP